ncbi:MAG TPA: hypothetical protein VNS10_12030 [Gemmatimonadaceae bacterium]|jgi:hypothetical protein|nr:hypothetical protein [Gemmatimonadaceae bacterium]
MRMVIVVTVATLGAWCDSPAQSWSAGAQAIPLVTPADPTATRAVLTEGYLTQPMFMAHAGWRSLRGVLTLNFEGLTQMRGELSTGGYGEGYVDRRHPHAYVHELLAGVEDSVRGTHLSLYAGRGFAPFGSDDPMVRPFEKYPVNHHLAQILERVLVVGAARAGPVIGELGVFNGDEPLSPGSAPKYSRFGDSWSSRVTLLPARYVELAGSVARVKSPEVPDGHGLDQNKWDLYARYDRRTADSRLYGLAEWAHTNEHASGAISTSLSSWMGEAAVCKKDVMAGLRLEGTDRPEEEPLADPFRTPRPPSDLSNLGVSRWTILTLAVSAPRLLLKSFSARPFVEVARIHAGPGDPPGLFDADLRYGTSWMWMFSAGVRLKVGTIHDRMGRYGAAVVPEPGTRTRSNESHDMPGMPAMPSPAPMTHHSNNAACTL